MLLFDHAKPNQAVWDYDYQYLVHPLPEISLEWGPCRLRYLVAGLRNFAFIFTGNIEIKSNESGWSNMLMTTSQDGVSRVWSCPVEGFGCALLGVSSTLHPETRSLHWLQAFDNSKSGTPRHPLRVPTSLNVVIDPKRHSSVDLGMSSYSDLFFRVDTYGCASIHGLTVS